jgi:hypothetical protein
MPRFLFPVDIANRGLDHIGSTRIDQALGFSELSRQSSAVAGIYDKLRRAELQRNTWRFAIKEAWLRAIDTNTTLLVPSLWSSTTTYFVGSIVADQYGTAWISNTANNVGNDPLLTSAWDEYFGPTAVPLWDATGKTAYGTGELVYTTPGDGTNRVYLSLIANNSDNPATPTAWSSTAVYDQNQVVTVAATAYMSRIDFNLNQNPATTFVAEWAIGTTYAINAKVTGSDGVIYQSIGNGNVGFDPTTRADKWTNTGVLSPWDTTFVSGAGSINWRQIGGAEFPGGVTVRPLNNNYPLGAGPSWQSTTRNAFRLPAGFLRKAPSDPKAGSLSYLGAASGLDYRDWNLESEYLTSSQTGPILLRFVADTVDVTKFDDMFCEGLGARIGTEVCETLTQSTAKKQAAASEYQKFMSEARTVNAVLVGAIEQPVDDWVECRG